MSAKKPRTEPSKRSGLATRAFQRVKRAIEGAEAGSKASFAVGSVSWWQNSIFDVTI